MDQAQVLSDHFKQVSKALSGLSESSKECAMGWQRLNSECFIDVQGKPDDPSWPGAFHEPGEQQLRIDKRTHELKYDETETHVTITVLPLKPKEPKERIVDESN